MVSLPDSDSALWFVLSWLAVWRSTALLCYEAGPFDLLTNLRRLLVQIGLGRLVTCFHCMALWLSAVAVGLVFEIRPQSVLIVLAVAGAASITERWLGGVPPHATEDSNDG